MCTHTHIKVLVRFETSSMSREQLIAFRYRAETDCPTAYVKSQTSEGRCDKKPEKQDNSQLNMRIIQYVISRHFIRAYLCACRGAGIGIMLALLTFLFVYYIRKHPGVIGKILVSFMSVEVLIGLKLFRESFDYFTESASLVQVTV